MSRAKPPRPRSSIISVLATAAAALLLSPLERRGRVDEGAGPSIDATAPQAGARSRARNPVDVSDRRLLVERLVRAREQERARIAADIHDDSIQTMSAVGLRLQMLRRKAADTEMRDSLHEVEDTVTEAITRLRHLLFDLQPPAHNGGGIVSAFRAYLEKTAADTGVTVELEERVSEEPSEETTVTAYRILQEALRNAVRHGRARRVHVLAEGVAGGLFVCVTDDGVGFSLDAVEPGEPGHVGIAAMRDRAEVAGGWWRATSMPGRGAIVEFWLPDLRRGTISA